MIFWYVVSHVYNETFIILHLYFKVNTNDFLTILASYLFYVDALIRLNVIIFQSESAAKRVGISSRVDNIEIMYLTQIVAK